MDGNGRWAQRRGLPRTAGHRAGVEAVRRVLEAAPGFGIGTLTLYAFSADNWKRPPTEVESIFGLMRRYLRQEAATLAEKGVRFRALGRRDRIPHTLLAAIEDAEQISRHGEKLSVHVAIDYSSRDAILQTAASLAPGGAFSRDAFSTVLGSPDVDLLIRTAGEQRLSDFLLWECAYAELHFTPRFWPDFAAADLAEAIRAFEGRERRFGALPVRAAAG